VRRGYRRRRGHGLRYALVGGLVLVTAAAVTLALLGRLPILQREGPGPAAVASGSPSMAPAAAVLPAAGDAGPVPTEAGLAARLAPLLGVPALGSRLGLAVVDIASGALLYGQGASTADTPASTTKLLTATAALSRLGPEHRLQTTVAVGSTPDRIVLVGGGDPTLVATKPAPGPTAPASLVTLAASTAAALKARGVTRVTLGYDTSLFSPQTASPAWPPEYVATGVIAPVTALAVREGRVGPEPVGIGPRVSDPPAAAARTFATLLADAGVTVASAPTPDRAPPAPSGSASAATSSSASGSAATSPSGAQSGTPAGTPSGTPSASLPAPGTRLAAVSSPPMADLVAQMLTLSDDDLAEALGHLVAVAAGETPDFAGAARAVIAEVAGLGVPTDGVRLYDTSGLARTDAIPPAVLTAVLSVVAQAKHPELRPVLTGLPVAGFTGTLDDRFVGATTRSAAGVLRAKTGTLSSVGTLAGTVLDADGRLLGFAFLSSGFTPGAALENRAALDRLAAAVAGCGCGSASAAPSAPTASATASPTGS
jgi:D-alanyl-D-alanine carboxypeptidase/D-alanyl-D-alanine-endopeptidase (penicillin-binding protein 4)